MLLAGLFALGLAIARVHGIALLHEVPYYLPGVTDRAYTFPEDTYTGRAFRVFGVGDDEGVYRLTWEEAEQACLDVGGIGLASAMNTDRKGALDRAIAESNAIKPPPKYPYWVGIYRAGLSDRFCVGGTVRVWPYFQEGSGDDTYIGCGKDEQRDWVWSRGGGRNNSENYIYWRDEQNPPTQFWESTERTGVPGGSKQPTGWSGDKTLAEGGGKYENCTVVNIYGDDNADVFDTARNVAFWRDYGCDSPIHRWICEMESEEQSFDADAIAARPPSALALNSPYFIAGVSDQFREVQDGPVLRLFGTVPSREALIWRTDWKLSWNYAQQACRAAGATGLATNPSPEHSIARGSLLKAAAATLFSGHGVNGFLAWMAGATTFVPANNTRTVTSTDFAWYPDGNPNVSEPLNHQQWFGSEYPVNSADAFWIDEEKEDPLTSCVVAAWDPLKPSADGRWKNVACDGGGVQYFICAFPDTEAGFAMAESEGSTAAPTVGGATPMGNGTGSSGGGGGSKTNVGGIAGGVIAAVVAAAVVIGAVFFMQQRRRRSNSAAERHGLGDEPAVPGAVPIPASANLDGAGKAGASGALRGAAVPPDARQQHPAPLVFLPTENSIERKLRESGGGGRGHTGNATNDTKTSDQIEGVLDLQPRLEAAPDGDVRINMTNHATSSAGEYSQSAVATFELAGVRTSTQLGGTTEGAFGVTSTSTTRGASLKWSERGGSRHEDPVDRLGAQLDLIIGSGGDFAGRYVMTDPSDRRHGGQGIVQFAKGKYNNYTYAIKFFLSTRAFDAEQAMYRNATLQRILPNIEDMYQHNAPVLDPHSEPLPPFIVMERGEALDEWSARAQPDAPTAVTMLMHIGTRLAELHAAGMAHRDLKPSNVMWLPRENRWTIIDFGCAANIDADAHITYSLAYAAPEVIRAVDEYKAKEREKPCMLVTAALDSWSLGVMAFELLTRRPALPLSGASVDDAVAQLKGEKPLPWEAPRLTSADKRALGILRQPILDLLSRDPEKRTSMAGFRAQCNRIFAGTTTHGSTGGTVDEDPSALGL